MKHLYITLALLLCLCSTTPTQGELALSNGWLRNKAHLPTLSCEDHYNEAIQALEPKDWLTVKKNLVVIIKNFPAFPCYAEAHYYLGVAYYYLDEPDYANECFSAYLKFQTQLEHFQEAIEYKYFVAERLRLGAKRRLFGSRQFPKWASGKSLALTIYDEVIAALPCHGLAARSLYAKGYLEWEHQFFRDSIESYQTLIKRFPKHELAPESYLAISKVYIDQCKQEYQNPDILALAEINLQRFESHFPNDERIACVEEDLQALKEIYAKGLYETGQFYERIHYPRASIIYYQNAISQFPETLIARACYQRLSTLCPNLICSSNTEQSQRSEDEDEMAPFIPDFFERQKT